MPLEIACPSCEGQFRVPDTAAGKKIRCPKCKGAIDVPASAPPAPAPPPPPTPLPQPAATKPQPKPEQWYLKTEEGEEYGPVSREELEGWKEDGRITADCQLLRAGSEQWQWANDVYPDLSSPEADATAEEQAAAEEPAPVRAASRAKEKALATTKSAAKTVVKPAKKPVPAPVEPPEDEGPPSSRSRLVAGLLGIFLGPLGTHRFYLGYWIIGLLMLLTAGGCGIWSLVDAILVLMGRVNDADGRRLSP